MNRVNIEREQKSDMVWSNSFSLQEEPSQKPPQIGSTADNPMTLDSSEDEADNVS